MSASWSERESPLMKPADLEIVSSRVLKVHGRYYPENGQSLFELFYGEPATRGSKAQRKKYISKDPEALQANLKVGVVICRGCYLDISISGNADGTRAWLTHRLTCPDIQ